MSRNTPLHVPQYRAKSTLTIPSLSSIYTNNEIYDEALHSAQSFDLENNYTHEPFTVPSSVRSLLSPIQYVPPPPLPTTDRLDENEQDYLHYTIEQSHLEAARYQVPLTPYAKTGIVTPAPGYITLQDEDGITALRESGRLARKFLDHTCHLARQPTSTSTSTTHKPTYHTTLEIDALLHRTILQSSAYPSPLNYAGFPRSICTSVNDVICHGIPDGRRLRPGDVASFDVSCFRNGYHGDNCATVLVGDETVDGTPRTVFEDGVEEHLFVSARRLILASRHALAAAVGTCRVGSCLSEVGYAVESVAEAYGYTSVEKYRGHGIGRAFHSPPFVKHYRNEDRLELVEGMVFTIEPMLMEGSGEGCEEWERDGWTVVTEDGGRASQFEHMVAIGEEGAEVLTVTEDEDDDGKGL